MLKTLSHILARNPLVGEIAFALTIKFILITLASIFLFGADQRVTVDDGVLTHQMFDKNLSQGM